MTPESPPPKSNRGGKRPGAGGVAKPLTPEAQAAVSTWHPAFRRVMERNQALGQSTRQAVFQLHCREGRSLAKVAHIMGLALSTVQGHWNDIRADLAANAQQTPEVLTAVRERMAAALEATIEETYHDVEIVDENGEKSIERGQASAPMIACRLKAFDQLAKLYGLNMESVPAGDDRQPYSTPPEIVEAVQRRVLELHGHGKLLKAGDGST